MYFVYECENRIMKPEIILRGQKGKRGRKKERVKLR
jgi:hypothetical protein